MELYRNKLNLNFKKDKKNHEQNQMLAIVATPLEKIADGVFCK